MEQKQHQKEWITIPVLPCASIEETLSFWELLGYEVTYKQTRPYQYGIVERGGYELHFGRVKGMDTSQNLYNGCLVMVADAGKVYSEFSEKFRKKYGKVTHSGVPRISRMKPGATRFTLTDVSGNSIIFISYGEQDLETYVKADDKNQCPLQKSIAMAVLFRDYKNDDIAAAKTLDAALKKTEKEAKVDIAEALIMRIDLADLMNEPVCASECKVRIRGLGLKEEEILLLQQKHQINFVL